MTIVAHHTPPTTPQQATIISVNCRWFPASDLNRALRRLWPERMLTPPSSPKRVGSIEPERGLPTVRQMRRSSNPAIPESHLKTALANGGFLRGTGTPIAHSECN